MHNPKTAPCGLPHGKCQADPVIQNSLPMSVSQRLQLGSFLVEALWRFVQEPWVHTALKRIPWAGLNSRKAHHWEEGYDMASRRNEPVILSGRDLSPHSGKCSSWAGFNLCVGWISESNQIPLSHKGEEVTKRVRVQQKRNHPQITSDKESSALPWVLTRQNLTLLVQP